MSAVGFCPYEMKILRSDHCVSAAQWDSTGRRSYLLPGRLALGSAKLEYRTDVIVTLHDLPVDLCRRIVVCDIGQADHSPLAFFCIILRHGERSAPHRRDSPPEQAKGHGPIDCGVLCRQWSDPLVVLLLHPAGVRSKHGGRSGALRWLLGQQRTAQRRRPQRTWSSSSSSSLQTLREAARQHKTARGMRQWRRTAAMCREGWYRDTAARVRLPPGPARTPTECQGTPAHRHRAAESMAEHGERRRIASTEPASCPP